jgi:hypothetical protein
MWDKYQFLFIFKQALRLIHTSTKNYHPISQYLPGRIQGKPGRRPDICQEQLIKLMFVSGWHDENIGIRIRNPHKLSLPTIHLREISILSDSKATLLLM